MGQYRYTHVSLAQRRLGSPRVPHAPFLMQDPHPSQCQVTVSWTSLVFHDLDILLSLVGISQDPLLESTGLDWVVGCGERDRSVT
jgi:hypothetical protein